MAEPRAVVKVAAKFLAQVTRSAMKSSVYATKTTILSAKTEYAQGTPNWIDLQTTDQSAREGKGI